MENYQEINKRAGLNKRAGRDNELDTQLVISSISVVKMNLYLIKLFFDKKTHFYYQNIFIHMKLLEVVEFSSPFFNHFWLRNLNFCKLNKRAGSNN